MNKRRNYLDDEICLVQEGLTVRDWFAGQALVGLVASSQGDEDLFAEDYASLAYIYADEMLEERK
jgi:hypothetical protein